MTAWRPASWGAVALACAVALGQVVALAQPSLRPVVLFCTVLLLDVLGVVFGLRAVRRCADRAPWWLATAARTVAVAAFCVLLWHVSSGTPVGYWLGVALRVLEFVLLAGAALAFRLREIRGRERWSFAAEITIVVSAGSMIAWYLVLGPALSGSGPVGSAAPAPAVGGAPGSATELVRLVSYVGGDLLMLTAVCALALGGARTPLAGPRTPLLGGLVLLLVADICWNASVASGATDQADNWLLGAGMVAAGLLLTVAPMVAVTEPGTRVADEPANHRRTGVSHLLVPLALLTGAGMMVAVTVRERALFPWGGLVFCLLLMVLAVLVHMGVSLRAARDLVTVDPLTGLANRTRLASAIVAATRRGDGAALLLIDLDDFKLINDAYGHAAGDAVLIELGHHLRAGVRRTDTCARIGGDEFAVLLHGPGDPDVVAQRILAGLAAHPVPLGDDQVTAHVSIGWTEHRPGDTGKDLMHRADLAMYAAKRLGTHSALRYDPSMVDRRALDAAIAGELSSAVARGEVTVVYQPIVDLATAGPQGYEALVRWTHPTRGPVPPLDFIPVAERTGLINDIGLHVLAKACAELAGLSDDQPYVSVNLSPRQLQSPTLVHDVLAELNRAGLAPARLVLEVTESAIVDDPTSIATLKDLREHGIRIAVDDFGTGYSSLHYLSRLPVDILKIDRSFVAELDGTQTGAAITEAVIRLAQALRLKTIAEGIETTAQAAELQTLGCPTGQGYLYARPGPLKPPTPVDAQLEANHQGDR